MDHLWDVSIVPVKDEADSVQEDSQYTNSMSFFAPQNAKPTPRETVTAKSAPVVAGYTDRLGSLSTKTIDQVLADLAQRISYPQSSLNQMSSSAAKNTAASSSRGVNNGDDHQSGARGESKRANGMFEFRYLEVAMRTDKIYVQVPEAKLLIGRKRTVSHLEDVESSRQVATKKIKSTAKSLKGKGQEKPRKDQNEHLKQCAAAKAFVEKRPEFFFNTSIISKNSPHGFLERARNTRIH